MPKTITKATNKKGKKVAASISANSTDKKKGQRKEEGNIGVGKGDRGAKRLDVIKAKSYT